MPITTTGQSMTMLICGKSNHSNHNITWLVISEKVAASNWLTRQEEKRLSV